MERHGIDEQEAFDMLRGHSRRTNRKVIDVADAVVSSHLLLPSPRRGVEPTSIRHLRPKPKDQPSDQKRNRPRSRVRREINVEDRIPARSSFPTRRTSLRRHNPRSLR